MSVAFVFPGQGSQYVGMGKDIYEGKENLRYLFDNADDFSKLQVKRAMFEGPEDGLKQTQITQPALFTHSLAVYQLIKDTLSADVFAGHSLGEFSALAAAGVFSIQDGLKLVSMRGALMSKAQEGTMAAIIGLDDDAVISICSEIDEVWPANFNSPGQVVISGSPQGIKQACAKAKEAGARRALPLPVSGAFHTPFMEKAAQEFRAYLEKFTFNTPRGKVIPNVTGEATDNPNEIKDLLARQLTSPVRWTKTMQTLAALKVTKLYEIGAGKVLCALAKRSMSGVECSPLGTLEGIDALTLS